MFTITITTKTIKDYMKLLSGQTQKCFIFLGPTVIVVSRRYEFRNRCFPKYLNILNKISPDQIKMT